MSCFPIKILYLCSSKVWKYSIQELIFWSIPPAMDFASQVPSRKMVLYIIWWTHENLVEGYLRRNVYGRLMKECVRLFLAYRGREGTVRWAWGLQLLPRNKVLRLSHFLFYYRDKNTLTKMQHKGESACIAYNFRLLSVFEESQDRNLRLLHPQSKAEVNKHSHAAAIFLVIFLLSYIIQDSCTGVSSALSGLDLPTPIKIQDNTPQTYQQANLNYITL